MLVQVFAEEITKEDAVISLTVDGLDCSRVLEVYVTVAIWETKVKWRKIQIVFRELQLITFDQVIPLC